MYLFLLLPLHYKLWWWLCDDVSILYTGKKNNRVNLLKHTGAKKRSILSFSMMMMFISTHTLNSIIFLYLFSNILILFIAHFYPPFLSICMLVTIYNALLYRIERNVEVVQIFLTFCLINCEFLSIKKSLHFQINSNSLTQFV